MLKPFFFYQGDDHVGDLLDAIGVIGQRTPSGMTEAEWRAGLAQFAQARGELEEVAGAAGAAMDGE